jgi:hypothetical protein
MYDFHTDQSTLAPCLSEIGWFLLNEQNKMLFFVIEFWKLSGGGGGGGGPK